MPRIRAENIAAHKAMTRRQILDSARENFLQFGYPAVSLGDIAMDAGIGRTTLYEYFEDKEAVLIELVNDELPTIVEHIVDGIPDGLSARESLGELVLRHLEFISDESNLGTMIMRDSNKLSQEAQGEIRMAHGRLEQAIGDAYEAGAATGEFRAMDPAQAAELINAVTMHAARGLLRSPDPKGEVHKTTDLVLDFLFDGLGSH
ncbi:MAG: TetR/AcrR family transcriptional regulator [Acidimicrobiia bacterium]